MTPEHRGHFNFTLPEIIRIHRPCVPHSEAAAGFALSHQLNTLLSKYFTGCSQQLCVCILTIRPPCWECTSSLEQAELFLYIAHLFLIFFCLISNHFEHPFSSSWIQALASQGCFLHSGTECKLGWRKDADSSWALSSLDTRGRRRKGQVTEKLKNSFKSPEGAYQTPEPNTFLQSHQNKERRLVWGWCCWGETWQGQHEVKLQGKDPSAAALRARWISASSTFVFLNSLGWKGP